LFKKYNIHATWAVVGAMLCENKTELMAYTPAIKPDYKEKILSPYLGFYDEITNENPQYFFGNTLFHLVKQAPHQELGTHTFSHYYCLEDGQTLSSFESDLKACISISNNKGFVPRSFIFPRHQLNKEYIATFPKYGIEIYRGTEKAWYNSPSKGDEEGILKRAFRFADYFVPMFSQHCQDIHEIKTDHGLYQIRASRWLRPYSKKWENLDFLKIHRIKSQMSYAAKRGKVFHLWFHPHDIGSDIDKNFHYLEIIMLHFQKLQKKYGMKSLNFSDIKTYIDESNLL